MKIIKLPKQEIIKLQSYYNEIHGMDEILSSFAVRRNFLKARVQMVLERAKTTEGKTTVNFHRNGIIESVIDESK